MPTPEPVTINLDVQAPEGMPLNAVHAITMVKLLEFFCLEARVLGITKEQLMARVPAAVDIAWEAADADQ